MRHSPPVFIGVVAAWGPRGDTQLIHIKLTRGVWYKMSNTAAKNNEFLEKDRRVKEEKERLRAILEDLDIDSQRMDIAKSLIANAAFMAITLQDLQDKINADGVVSEYQNGENQWGTKQSPEASTYISLVNRHNAVMKQLLDLLPKEEVTNPENIIEKFEASRPD